MIFLADVFDGLLPAFVTEVDVEIRHGDAVGVQKPLEEEVILERVDVGDADGVGDDARRAAAAPRPYRDAALLGPLDKVHDDEVILGKAHAEDDAQLVIGALFDRFGDLAVAAAQPLPRQPGQIVFGVGAVLGRVAGDERLVLDGVAVVFEVEAWLFIALFGDDEGIGDRLGHIREQFRHLFRRFEVKFVGIEFHALGIVDGALCLDAHQYVLHLPVFGADIMHVVGGDRRDAELFGKLQQKRQHAALLFQPVVLYLDIKIFAEDLFQLQRRALCPLIVAAQQQARDPAREAGGKAHQPLAVFAQRLIIDARLIIKAVYIGDGIQLDQVMVPLFVLCQQNEVLERGGIVFDVQVLRHVQLAADDGLDVVFAALLGKLQRRVHVAVVGDGDGLDSVFGAVAHQLLDLAGAVQQTIFCMYM